jgi:hypothetical protein
MKTNLKKHTKDFQFYIAFPILKGKRYYVATAQGTIEKALAEAQNWIKANKLAGEKWAVEIIPLKTTGGVNREANR